MSHTVFLAAMQDRKNEERTSCGDPLFSIGIVGVQDFPAANRGAGVAYTRQGERQ
jgi:hypothetical protein